jgi:hypothetical protein
VVSTQSTTRYAEQIFFFFFFFLCLFCRWVGVHYSQLERLLIIFDAASLSRRLLSTNFTVWEMKSTATRLVLDCQSSSTIRHRLHHVLSCDLVSSKLAGWAAVHLVASLNPCVESSISGSCWISSESWYIPESVSLALCCLLSSPGPCCCQHFEC